MRGVLDPPVSAFSLSLYRHPFLYTLFSSRFTLIINNNHYTHIPLPSLAPSIPCPASDRCATAVPVGTPRRSVPVIRRFCPFLGWRTILQLLARRVAESNVFSVPDCNALWSRAEDDLLVQAVAKYSTYNVLRREWSEVTTRHGSCPGALSSSAKSVTVLLILWCN